MVNEMRDRSSLETQGQKVDLIVRGLPNTGVYKKVLRKTERQSNRLLQEKEPY